MTGTVSALTIETAPRDLEALKDQGRYRLRRLAEDLGIIKSDKEKADWMGATAEEMAQAVFKELQEYDTRTGGKTKTKKTKRQPVTKADESNGQTGPAVPAPADGPAKAPAKAASAEMMVTPAAVQEDVRTLQSSITKLADKLEEALSPEVEESLMAEVAALSTMVANLEEKMMVQLALNLFLAEQVLEAPRMDILNDAIKTAEEIRKLLEADEEEDAEGN